jgi:hypothetical protein
MRCAARFNQRAFREFLEFNNVGVTERVGKKTYVRRFSSEEIEEKVLLQRFFSACDFEKTISTLEEPMYFDENRL